MKKQVMSMALLISSAMFAMDRDRTREEKQDEQAENNGLVELEDLQDLEMGSQEDDSGELSNAILARFHRPTKNNIIERMHLLALMATRHSSPQTQIRARRTKKNPKTSEILAHALSEELHVQQERNRLMAKQSKVAKIAAFIAACGLITNIVNVWLSHPGKK